MADDMHFGRSWDGHALEDACPCDQAPCGLIAAEDPECPEHGVKAARTMRQLHRAADCPERSAGREPRS